MHTLLHLELGRLFVLLSVFDNLSSLDRYGHGDGRAKAKTVSEISRASGDTDVMYFYRSESNQIFNCNFKTSCLLIWVTEPSCRNGTLEDRGSGYVRISLKVQHCQPFMSGETAFSVYWTIETKHGLIREIQRCRNSIICRVPVLPVTHSSNNQHWFNIWFCSRNDLILGFLSLTFIQRPALIEHSKSLKVVPANFNRKSDVKEHQNHLINKQRNTFAMSLDSSHQKQSSYNKPSHEVGAMPKRSSLLFSTNFPDQRDKTDFITRSRNSLLQTVLINSVTFSRGENKNRIIIPPWPAKEEDMKPVRNNVFQLRSNSSRVPLHYKSKNKQRVNEDLMRLRRGSSNAQSQSILYTKIMHRPTKASDLLKVLEVVKQPDFRLSPPEQWKLAKPQSLQRRKRQAYSREAEDLAALMQGETPGSKEKMAEMIASGFSSPVKLDDPVVAKHSVVGRALDKTGRRLDSLMGELRYMDDETDEGSTSKLSIPAMKEQLRKKEKDLKEATAGIKRAWDKLQKSGGGSTAFLLDTTVSDAKKKRSKLESEVNQLRSDLKDAEKRQEEAQDTAKGKILGVKMEAEWQEWSGWGMCSGECGDNGISVRRRECLTLPNIPCSGSNFDVKQCEADENRCRGTPHFIDNILYCLRKIKGVGILFCA